MMEKLLRPFTGTGAVFFPVGKPPTGTCERASDECIRKCYANNDRDFDEEVRIPEEEKREIYEYIMTAPISHVVWHILDNLDGLQTPILHWFGTGDCLTKDIDRISEVIDAIPPEITQMGFTRNVALWERHKNVFALTIENKEEALGRTGIFSVPDYNEEISHMYSTKYKVLGGRCGPYICEDDERPDIAHYINCRTCLRQKSGCFDRRHVLKEDEPA